MPQTSAKANADSNAGAAALDRMKGADPSKGAPVLYLGLGAHANQEASTLAKATAHSGGVDPIMYPVGQGPPPKGTPAQTEQFLQSLALPEDKHKQLAALLDGKLAGQESITLPLVRSLWDAETGKHPFVRFVLAGHSDGATVWGDDTGLILEEDLVALINQFPVARAGVRDVMLSACNNGWQVNVEYYRKVFPNMRSYWSYTMKSPGVETGSLQHITTWEKSTEPGKQTPSRNGVVGSLPKASHPENVAIWTAEGGYQSGPGLTHAEQTRRENSYQNPHWHKVFDDAFNGTCSPPLGDTALPALMAYTEVLQSTLGDPTTPESDRKDARYRNDVVLRLRFWISVCTHFGAAHGTVIAGAVARCNRTRGAGEQIPVPDWPRLPRAQALSLCDTIDKAAQADPTDKELGEACALLWQLKTLSSESIPPTWC